MLTILSGLSLGNNFLIVLCFFLFIFFSKVEVMSGQDALIVQSLQSKSVFFQITIYGDYSKYFVYIKRFLILRATIALDSKTKGFLLS